MTTFLTVLHVSTCVLLILVVLIQQGKGAEISASLGGSSQTVFGSSGGATFFTRFTSTLAGIFMFTSVTLTIAGSHARKSVFDGAPPAKATQTQSAPAQPAAPAANTAAPAAATAPAKAPAEPAKTP